MRRQNKNTPTKRETPKQPRKLRARTGLEIRQNAVFLQADDLDRLKTSEDFVDLVRAMRLSNFLNYALDQVVKEVDETSSAGRLAYVRARLNLGGYLHEGVNLLGSLDKRHNGKSYFSKGRQILVNLTKRDKEIIRLVRNNAAFHLDHDDYSTRSALKKLVLLEWEFLAADTSMRKDQYYVLADSVDLNYIIDQLKKFEGAPDRALFLDEKAYEGAILSEIFNLLIRLTKEMATATSDFISELTRRLGLVK